MDIKDIYDLLYKGERITLECKLSKSAIPNSIWETYSAFANTYGGIILLGVHEDLEEKDAAKRFVITGVENADKIRKDLWNMLNNTEKVSVNLLKDEDVDEVIIDGKTVVYINVPRADVSIRPVYVNGNPIRGAYKRNHEGDYHLPQAELRMMLRDADNESNDHMVLEHYTMQDVDMPSIVAYRNRFSSHNPDHVWNKLGPKEFLMQFGCYDIDRNTGKEWLTLAGLLMFGKGLPIRQKFGNLRMDYIDKSNLIGEQRYSDRLTYDGTWENNLYNFLEMVLPKLLRELPRPFKMEGIIRVDDTPQHKAVREAFTNAIIHADLQMEGLLRVVKYNDRLEFTNPGLLKLPVERIYAGEESKARNQSMQNLLRMIGFGEGLGSGFPLILDAWNEKQWPRPELVEEQDLMQVKLVLKIGINKGSVLKNVSKSVLKELSDRQLNIIQFVQESPDSTWAEMSERLKVSSKTIQRDIKDMQEKGILSREGGRADGYWVIHNTDQ